MGWKCYEKVDVSYKGPLRHCSTQKQVRNVWNGYSRFLQNMFATTYHPQDINKRMVVQMVRTSLNIFVLTYNWRVHTKDTWGKFLRILLALDRSTYSYQSILKTSDTVHFPYRKLNYHQNFRLMSLYNFH